MKNNKKLPFKIAIVVSRFNEDITHRLLLCCREELLIQGVLEKNIDIFKVPGAYELPFAAQQIAKKKKWDAVVALGCVIKGETSHDQNVAQWATLGLGQVSLQYQIPVFFGVLTPNTEKQAMERSKAGPLNRGKEVAAAACEMLQMLPSIK